MSSAPREVSSGGTEWVRGRFLRGALALALQSPEQGTESSAVIPIASWRLSWLFARPLSSLQHEARRAAPSCRNCCLSVFWSSAINAWCKCAAIAGHMKVLFCEPHDKSWNGRLLASSAMEAIDCGRRSPLRRRSDNAALRRKCVPSGRTAHMHRRG